MPELPEVETVVRQSRPRLVGRAIVAFASRWPRQVSPGVGGVRARLRGAKIESVARRAKFIVLNLSNRGSSVGALLIHLRMSGRFEWGSAGDARAKEPKHVRATFDLDDGTRLYFCDARKFGRIVYTADPTREFAALGPEPLEDAFTPRVLGQILKERRRLLKPLLLDQRAVAGLGNIYADEALYHARLHPLCSAAALESRHVKALHGAIRQVLDEGIRRNGTSFDWVYPEGQMQDHLAVYGRAGEPCRRCGDEIVALRVGQRGTHVCLTCQERVGNVKK